MSKITALLLNVLFFITCVYPEWEYSWIARSMLGFTVGVASAYLLRYDAIVNENQRLLKRLIEK